MKVTIKESERETVHYLACTLLQKNQEKKQYIILPT